VVAPDPGKVALARVVVEARDAGEALSGAEGEHDLRQRRGHRHHPPDLGGHRRAQMLPWPRREQQGNKQHQRTVQQTLPAPQVLVSSVAIGPTDTCDLMAPVPGSTRYNFPPMSEAQSAYRSVPMGATSGM